VVFTRQTATLLEAGMPLLRGLRLIREQESNACLRQVIEQLGDSIEGGASISEAMSQHPRTFNRLYLQMVRAGELSGALDVVLRRLADLMEKAQRIKNKVVSALFYPAAVLFVAIAVLGVLIVFVVPRFNEIFSGLMNGKPMPAFTQFVLGISTFARDHLFLTIGFLGALVVGVTALGRTRAGRGMLDRLKLSLPLFGELLRKTAVVRFTRTLGTLVTNGVPILQALQVVKDTTGNVVVSKAVQAVHDSVADGETISTPLRMSGVFPALVTGMVDIGEQTGALPEMLTKIADTYEDEVDHTVSALTSLLEPVMIVFLAVIVGAIVIALFLPLVDVVTNADFTGGGGGGNAGE
jgi:type IV pilus assembly protein PilC